MHSDGQRGKKVSFGQPTPLPPQVTARSGEKVLIFPYSHTKMVIGETRLDAESQSGESQVNLGERLTSLLKKAKTGRRRTPPSSSERLRPGKVINDGFVLTVVWMSRPN